MFLKIYCYSTPEKTIYIEPGTSLWQIDQKFTASKLSPFIGAIFIGCCLNGCRKKIKPGEYHFIKQMNFLDVLRKLIKGDRIIYKVTFPEGITSYGIVAILNNIAKLEGCIEEYPEEGSCWPDTYYYHSKDSRKKIINEMQKIMAKKVKTVFEKRSENSIFKSPKDILILASIIEKEAGTEEEKPRIAAVLLNRLTAKMRLQADPTVIYAITQGKEAKKLNHDDLQIDSPYNTYKYYGLPPGPICCPGENSLVACVQPSQSKELYFVLSGDGKGHNFSENYTQHCQNIKKWKDKMQ